MKNKYITPQTWITEVDCSTHFMVGSPTGDGKSIIGEDESKNKQDQTITTTPGSSSGLTQCSKGFNAWESWDE